MRVFSTFHDTVALCVSSQANLVAIRQIVGQRVESRSGKASWNDTPTSKQLRDQGHRWAQHVLEGPISWMLSALYIAGTVVGGGTPLTGIVAIIHAAVNSAVAVQSANTSLPTNADFATVRDALLDAAGSLADNASIVEAMSLLSHAEQALGSAPSTGLQEEDSPAWVAIKYIVAVTDAAIYIFLPWWTTVLIRLVQGRPWLHRVASRSVLIGDVPWVAQAVEAFASKCFALAYKNASISVMSANAADHLVHRHTHRVVRGALLAVGRPDGRLNALSSAENTVCLSVNQASSIQNYGVTCESITIGHNPFELSLAERGITIPSCRPQFLCERELELDMTSTRKAETCNSPSRNAKPPERSILARLRSTLGSLMPRVTYAKSKSYLQGMDDSKHSMDDSKHELDRSNGSNKGAARQFLYTHVYSGLPTMSPSALMGAMEQLTHSNDEGSLKEDELQSRTLLCFDTVVKSLDIAKTIRESVRKHACKPGGRPPEFKRIEPVAEPFLGAWMATVPEFRQQGTGEAFARQRLLQELYESRYASMQRLVSFFVLFHEMGKSVQDFWPRVSFGWLKYDMSRTQVQAAQILQGALLPMPHHACRVRAFCAYNRVAVCAYHTVRSPSCELLPQLPLYLELRSGSACCSCSASKNFQMPLAHCSLPSALDAPWPLTTNSSCR